MTTRIHIVNFGPDAVDVATFDPETGKHIDNAPSFYAQQSTDLYVHSTQAVTVTEVVPKETKQ